MDGATGAVLKFPKIASRLWLSQPVSQNPEAISGTLLYKAENMPS